MIMNLLFYTGIQKLYQVTSYYCYMWKSWIIAWSSNCSIIYRCKSVKVSTAVFEVLHDWSIISSIINKTLDFGFDTTTASNTGRFKGVCTILQQTLGREIFFLACRHHVLEIVLQGVFDESGLKVMSGLEIQIFKRFKKRNHQILIKTNMLAGTLMTENCKIVLMILLYSLNGKSNTNIHETII